MVNQFTQKVVGRDDLLRELLDTVEARDVVLSGPPGVGKTTMARSVAAATGMPVVFCDLTDARELRDLVSLVARALGLEPRAGAPVPSEVERVADVVASRPAMLLVMDNVDHVSAHVDEIDRWPCRKLLTCRSRVPLADAAQVTVAPLDEDAALKLFELRAAAVAPGFTVREGTEPTVRELVRRLDYLPLAIELAAARAHVLRPEQLLERMDQRLATLTDQRTGRSLGGALAWTWELLGKAERACVVQASVLRGEFTFQEAEAVMDVGDVSILDVIDRVVTAGWLRSRGTESGERLFGMFESVRDFAATKLSDAERTRFEHAYALVLHRQAVALADEVPGKDGVDAFVRLAERESNFRWAVEHLLNRRDRAAPELVSALTYPILFDSRVVDWLEPVTRAIELAEEHDLVTAVRLLQLRGQMELLTRKRAAAEETLRRANALARQTQDDRVRVDAARTHCIAVSGHDPGAAAETLEALVEDARGLRAEFLTARTLERLGFARSRLLRLDGAYDAFEEAHDVFLRVSNPLFGGESLTGMGYVAWRRGHLNAARDAFSQAVQMHDKAGNRTREAGARFNLATILHALGRTDDAAHQYEVALERWESLALLRYRPAALVRRALVECETGPPEEARRLAREARAQAAEHNDQHNVALADGVIALTRVIQEREPDRDALEYTLATLNMGADPVAVGAHLAILVGTVDEAARREHFLNRIDEVRSLASEQDVYVDETLLVIDHLATGLAGLSYYVDQGDRSALGLVRVARDSARTESAGLNPYARLLSRWLEARCATSLQGVDLSGGRTLRVHRDAHWFQLDDGETVDLTTRKPLRLLLRHFVGQAQSDPLAGSQVTDLIEVGWPGENVTESAGKNRVYTAIRFLRDMGLEGVIITGDSGYRIAPDVRVEVEGQAEARR